MILLKTTVTVERFLRRGFRQSRNLANSRFEAGLSDSDITKVKGRTADL